MTDASSPALSSSGPLEIDVGELTATTKGGSGTVTLGTYGADPEGAKPSDASGTYFDVKAPTGSVFKSATVEDCSLSGGRTLMWWNPTARSGVGGWAAVSGTPGPTYKAGSSPCISVTLTAASEPNLDDLSGTVFAVTDAASVAAKKSPKATSSTSRATTTPPSQSRSGDSSGSPPQLAFTGFNPLPLAVLGLLIVCLSEGARRRLRGRARTGRVVRAGDLRR